MPSRYRAAAEGHLRFSPIWEGEAVVFNPQTAEIFVVSEIGARVLQTIQAHGSPSVENIRAGVGSAFGGDGVDAPREAVAAMLLEFQRVGLVETVDP